MKPLDLLVVAGVIATHLLPCFASASADEAQNGGLKALNDTVPACYCHCAPVITVSCPSSPPTCPTEPTPPGTETTAATSSTPTTIWTTTTTPGTTSTLSTTSATWSSPTVASSTLSSTVSTNPTTLSTASATSPITTLPSSTAASTTTTATTASTTIPTTMSTTTSSTAATPSTSVTTTPPTTTTLPPNTTCSSVFNSNSGWFASPGYPSSYSHNTDCRWLINATDRVVITFHIIRIGQADYVTVYDGPTVSSVQLLNATGVLLPPPSVLSSSSQVLVSFTSRSSGGPGFYASYSATPCPSVLNSDSGWIASPNYPSSYSDHAYGCWLINATGMVVITFSAFDTEPNYDFVTVYDGPTVSSTRLLSFSGSSVPSPVTSSSGQVLVTFTSDYSVTRTGFNASYSLYTSSTSSTGTSPAPTTPLFSSTTVTGGSVGTTDVTNPTGTRPTTSGPILDNCQALLQTDSGTFASPYYPQNYPNNANCSWLITASGRIVLSFRTFRTEGANDVVKVYDGPTTSYSRLLSASGSSIPSAVTSSNYLNQVLITFTSDSSVTDLGFNASYTLYVPPTSPPNYYCGESITSSSGFITSPNFPDGYPDYSRCTWTITTQPGTRIQFHFTDFSTRPGDYVEVFGCATCSSSSSRIISQSGNVSSICGFISDSNSLRITFSSSASSGLYRGFRASFTTDHDCGGTFNSSDTGVISSPGYNINGTFSYSDCKWKIQVQQGSSINFTLSSIVGAGQSFNVYEGLSTSNLIASVGATPSLYPHVVSKSNEIVVTSSYYPSVCQAAGSNDGKWRASYTAAATPAYGCYGRMNTEARMVSSPGFPFRYPERSLTCQWKIEEAATKKIRLNFPSMINLAPRHTLTAYDGPSTNSPRAFYIEGTVHPMPILLSSNESLIVFTTSYSYSDVYYNLYTGWNITWDVVDRP